LRSLILFIVLLAAAKFGYQDYAYRNALADALINAYRQDAVQRCQQESKVRNLAVGYNGWNEPKSLSLIVGRSARDALALDFMPNATPTNTYLVIVARKADAEVRCEFDIVRLSASVALL
jgi:hypothetical protein